MPKKEHSKSLKYFVAATQLAEVLSEDVKEFNIMVAQKSYRNCVEEYKM